MTRLRSPRHLCVTAAAVLTGSFLFTSATAPAQDAPPPAPPAQPAPPATAPAKPPVSQVEKVNHAIRRGVEYLYSVQKKDGSWENVPQPKADGGPADVDGKQWGGLTAMATYALLASGENPQDPRLAKAIDWLLKSDKMVGNYALGMRAQVWLFLPDNHPKRAEIRSAIKRDFDVNMLGWHKNPKDAKFGFYPYFAALKDHFDRSVSQYGVLGMWALAQAGAEVPNAYWETVDKAWKKSQQPEGGWNYSGDGFSTPSMTAAGLATLFITEDYLTDAKAPCTGNKFNQNIELALAWMDRNVPAIMKGNDYYTLYGVERIGVASGRKYFGKTPWYDTGAANLVGKQRPDGSWGDAPHSPSPISSTSFCLYFLTRGRAPVIMNKLEWKSLAKEGLESGWNQRHRDLANFSWWMRKNLDGRYINWQVVNLKGDVDDLHDSPILYIAGSETLAFSPEDTAKLKKFVEDGGLILGNADCGKAQFTKSFKALGKAIYPGDEFRQLPTTHPLFASDNVQFKASKWKTKPEVLGLSNGVRELMILIPTADPAKAWQSRSDRTREEMYQLGANLSLYSNGGQNLRFRGVSHIVKDAGKTPANSIRVARIRHKGNFDPEPGGWRRMANVMKNANVANLTDYDKPVELGKDQLGGFKFASMTGTAKFELTQPERDELKKFVEGGGTLLVDAAGGSADFGDSAEKELAAIFGDAAKKGLAAPLPGDHPLFNAPKIESFDYRSYARKVVGRSKAPRLKGITVNDRLGVVFSREDISGGLVGQEVDGIVGYSPETATEIVRNILTSVGAAAVADAPAPAAPAARPAAAGKPAAPAASAGGK